MSLAALETLWNHYQSVIEEQRPPHVAFKQTFTVLLGEFTTLVQTNPVDFTSFPRDVLIHPEATYLIVDLRKVIPETGYTLPCFKKVGFVGGDTPHAVDLVTGANLGALNDAAFKPIRDFTRADSETRPFVGFSTSCNPAYLDRHMIFPLTGPLCDLDGIGHLAQIGNAIANGTHEAYRAYIDACRSVLPASQAVSEAERDFFDAMEEFCAGVTEDDTPAMVRIYDLMHDARVEKSTAGSDGPLHSSPAFAARLETLQQISKTMSPAEFLKAVGLGGYEIDWGLILAIARSNEEAAVAT